MGIQGVRTKVTSQSFVIEVLLVGVWLQLFLVDSYVLNICWEMLEKVVLRI